MTPAGLPHSEIPGSTVVCTSPRLIAACHVLHRFPEPRHPPYALPCLTSISSSPRARSGRPACQLKAGSTAAASSRPPWPPARTLSAGNHVVSTNSLGAPCQRSSGSPAGAFGARPPQRHCPAVLLKTALLLNRYGSTCGAAQSVLLKTALLLVHARPLSPPFRAGATWWRIPGSNR